MDNFNQQSQATPDQTSPVPVTLHQGNKNFVKLGMLFAVIFLFLGSGTYLVLNKNVFTQQKPTIVQTTNPTPASTQTESSWKTYTSNTYHFSIQYPNDWTLDEKEGRPTFYPPGVTRGMWEAAPTPMPGGDPSISVGTLRKPLSQSTSQDKEMIETQSIQDFEIITIDGIQGYYYRLEGCAPICPTYFELPYENGNKTLQFQLFSMHQEDIDIFNEENKTNIKDADKETFRKMIKTITFL